MKSSSRKPIKRQILAKLALEKSVKKARLILAVTEQVSEDNFERHYKTVEIEVPENKHMNLSECDIIGGEWIS